ncbi:MAG: hypothetical protein IPF62_10940 [Bacteroidetes bacterium]|nr:hypothetical protein [Bacteroidota bacterium]
MELGGENDSKKDKRKVTKNQIKKKLGLNPKQEELEKEFIMTVISTIRSLETMKRLYNIEKFKKFNGAKFFKSGNYIIPEEDVKPILKDLEPLIKDILAEIINDSNTQVKIIIGVYGYSDEQIVKSGTSLYDNLMQKIRSDPEKMMYSNLSLNSQLNYKLSQLRSESLKKLLISH